MVDAYVKWHVNSVNKRNRGTRLESACTTVVFEFKVITRWLKAILKMTEEWEVSVSSKKINPPGRALALGMMYI